MLKTTEGFSGSSFSWEGSLWRGSLCSEELFWGAGESFVGSGSRSLVAWPDREPEPGESISGKSPFAAVEGRGLVVDAIRSTSQLQQGGRLGSPLGAHRLR